MDSQRAMSGLGIGIWNPAAQWLDLGIGIWNPKLILCGLEFGMQVLFEPGLKQE